MRVSFFTPSLCNSYLQFQVQVSHGGPVSLAMICLDMDWPMNHVGKSIQDIQEMFLHSYKEWKEERISFCTLSCLNVMPGTAAAILWPQGKLTLMSSPPAQDGRIERRKGFRSLVMKLWSYSINQSWSSPTTELLVMWDNKFKPAVSVFLLVCSQLQKTENLTQLA